MQTDKNDMKVEQSVSMHSLALKRPCKCQIVTDPKLRNASQIYFEIIEIMSILKLKISISCWTWEYIKLY